jgi:acetyltransferase-like isoleucine patch superfamily enzyme
MCQRLKNFWTAPFYNQLNMLSGLYYLTKGALWYRLVFKEFGNGSCLRKPLLLLNPNFISIGERVLIRDGVRLEVIRSNPSRNPALTIGDDTNIEQNVHIVCHSRVSLGKNVSITGNCSIVDVTHPFSDLSNPTKIGVRILDEDSFVEIGDGTFVGFGAVILPNVRIGKCAIIGANSVVVSDVPDYAVVAGVPAAVLKRYDFAQGAWVRESNSVVRVCES